MLSAMQPEPDVPEGGAERRMSILGAGLMGSQIGCEYALGGWTVSWLVRDSAVAEGRVDSALALALRHGIADAEAVRAARARMDFCEAGQDVGGEAEPELIVESLPEEIELKAAVLGPLCASHPAAMIASNTSSISITALARAAGAVGRTLGTHYWNPPLLMPLVEIVAAEGTPARALDGIAADLRALGKRPVKLAHEVPGLLWNRLQLAVLRECLWLVESGVATPQAIDEVMRDGLARRWRLTGPFETVGLGGAATFDAIAANLFPLLSDAGAGSGFGPHVPSDPALLGELRERRDTALAAELHAERAGRVGYID
jgi:3-hydroxybutyryl-CoA dehydrogenase